MDYIELICFNLFKDIGYFPLSQSLLKASFSISMLFMVTKKFS